MLLGGSFKGSVKGSIGIGGSWAVISGVISPLIWVIIIATLLITTHEPPSRVWVLPRQTATVYNRATIKGLIYLYYKDYSTVTEWGQYPS